MGNLKEMKKVCIDFEKTFKELVPEIENKGEVPEILQKLFEVGTNPNILTKFLKVTGMTVHEFEYMNTEKFIKALSEFDANLKKSNKGEPVVQSRKPKTLNIINDRFSNSILRDAMNTERCQTSGHYKPLGESEISFFNISTVDDTALNLKNVTEYDKHLQNVIGSFMATGQDTITLDGLCRLIIDKDDAGGTHASQRAYVWERLQEQAKIISSFTLADGREIGGNMISFRFVKEPPADNEPIGNVTIQFTCFPILYENARSLGQVLPVPLEYLKIYEQVKVDKDGNLIQAGKRVRETPERIAIKSYLLRRTALITSGNKKSNIKSNRILFDTVFDECGLTVDRRHKGDYIKYIELVLQNWKSKEFIQGYEIAMNGRSKIGVDINPKTVISEK